MKYRVKSKITNEIYLCDKITLPEYSYIAHNIRTILDEFDYYVETKEMDNCLIRGEFYIDMNLNKLCQQNSSQLLFFKENFQKSIIATNNPLVDSKLALVNFKILNRTYDRKLR